MPRDSPPAVGRAKFCSDGSVMELQLALLNPEDRASNRLLTHLPEEDQERLRQFLEPVVLDYKSPLYTADERIEFVHFIESGVGSLVCAMADGRAAEVVTVRNEGFAS